MAVTKKKTYIFAPTCKQINAILRKGWKVTFVNDIMCQKGDVISIPQEEQDGFSMLFEKCDNNEEYYCLQRFVYYTLWSEEEYAKAMEEIEAYRKQGAYIITALPSGKAALTWKKEIVPPLLSVLEKEKVDVLYYIIIPKAHVKDCDEERSFNEMLTYLGFRVYPDVVCRMSFLPCVILAVWNILIDEGAFLAFFNWSAFLVFFGLFCLGARDFFWFFSYRLYRKEYSFRYRVSTLTKSKC